MTFLELVKGVRSRVGMQGTGPASVLTASTAEMDLVTSVYDAWVDIQNFRDDWRWMRGTTSFLLAPPKEEYILSDIFGPNNRFKTWRKDTCRIVENGKKKYLIYLEYDKYIAKYLNSDKIAKPTYYTIRPWDNALMFNNPKAAYTITIDYQKSPQLLANNEDVPELPVSFHLLIVYAAVEKYDTVVISNTSYDQYALQHMLMLGQLMRNQLPKKVVRLNGGIA